MTARGPRPFLAALPFVASLVVAAVATGIEANGQARMGPAEWRIGRRAKDVSLRAAITEEDPREIEAARAALPFDAMPRRWLAWIHSRADAAGGIDDAPLSRAVAEGLDRRPRDPVLLFLAGEAALSRGDEAASNRLRTAAIEVGPHEGWMIERFAQERLETGRAHGAAAAAHRERARALVDALDLEGAETLRREAVREMDEARRALEVVVALRAALSPEVRARGRIERLADEAAKDLADVAAMTGKGRPK